VGWLAFVFALLSGAAITAQAGSNAQLKRCLGSPLGALIMNYVLGLIGIVLASVFARVPIPATEKMASTPWWAWMGGLLGIMYGLSVVLLASRMGAATLIAAVVTGQLIFSVLVDHFAWIGFEAHRASPLRILGCALMIIGLALIAKF
jgi:bacterial/archaeal transporter family-2 protein